MNFFRWLWNMSKRSRAARARIEVSLEGIADDVEEVRKRQRVAWGLEAPALGDRPKARLGAKSK